MKTLRNILEDAESKGVAVGHFNFSDFIILKAIFKAARDLIVPVIVGASEGERQFMGARQAADMVRSFRDQYDFPIFLNADHTHSLPSSIEAAKAGFDWIVFDVSTVPFEENIRQTKAAVEALKSLRPGILVEGEIGDIGSGSEIHDAAPDLRKGLSTPAQAKQFVEETRVDTLAPAVGNMHPQRTSRQFDRVSALETHVDEIASPALRSGSLPLAFHSFSSVHLQPPASRIEVQVTLKSTKNVNR